MRTIGWICLVGLLPFAGALAAEEPTGPSGLPINEAVELGGHRFLYPQLQEPAFVATSFTSRLGVGMERAERVPFGPLGARTLQVAGLQQQLEVSVRIARMVGVYLQVRGGLVTGVNGRTLLLRTGELEVDARGGAIVRLWRGEKSGTQISARLTGGVSSRPRLSLVPLVNALVAAPLATTGSVFDGNLTELLVVPATQVQVRAGVHLAQAIVPAFSIQLALAATGTHREEHPFDPMTDTRLTTVRNSVRGDTAVALELDGSTAHIPIALLAEYRLAFGRTEESGLTNAAEQTVGAGLYYSGRHDLQLGLEFSYRLSGPSLEGLDLRDLQAASDPVRRITAALLFRYIW